MRQGKPLHRMMIVASFLSWLLLIAMPVVNAHHQPAGTWASLCTLGGFKLVKLADGKDQLKHDTQGHCPIGVFSLAHIDERWLGLGEPGLAQPANTYQFTPRQWHYFLSPSRAPPAV
ncbi:hypothetical protein KCG43_15890 [Photobacterium sp. WH24]|uniref:DUF2946 domain-containing protein n=2 Tax=Vibrionaceae TaxID=641 RepID=A0ABR9BLW7_9GAMM|nr:MULTISPECIES: hypothetical protein [Photobacterium]MBD8513564.1 hypothetical protein [Photobacterium arenosum]MBV7263485.1 hypothetical protein [Photobacterium sp. WH24]MCG2846356.1 hypothetical protein [Photobacterium sp. WH80]